MKVKESGTSLADMKIGEEEYKTGNRGVLVDWTDRR